MSWLLRIVNDPSLNNLFQKMQMIQLKEPEKSAYARNSGVNKYSFLFSAIIP